MKKIREVSEGQWPDLCRVVDEIEPIIKMNDRMSRWFLVMSYRGVAGARARLILPSKLYQLEIFLASGHIPAQIFKKFCDYGEFLNAKITKYRFAVLMESF